MCISQHGQGCVTLQDSTFTCTQYIWDKLLVGLPIGKIMYKFELDIFMLIATTMNVGFEFR
jgi:hypothetical protein